MALNSNNHPLSLGILRWKPGAAYLGGSGLCYFVRLPSDVGKDKSSEVEWVGGNLLPRGLTHMAGQLVLAVGERSLSSLSRGPLHRFVRCLEDTEVGTLQSGIAKRSR